MKNNQVAVGKRTGYKIDFVGRNNLLRAQVDKVLSGPSFIGVIYGPCGVGKSTFASRLIEELNSEDHPNVKAFGFEIEVAQAAEESFLYLYGGIYETVRLSGINRVREAFSNPVVKSKKIATGFAKDLLARFTGNLKHTTDELSKIVTESVALVSQKKLRSQVGRSNFSKLIDALEAAAARSPQKFVLVLDGMERASEKTIALLDSVSRRLPDNIRVLLVINSEDPAFGSSDFVTLKSRLQYQYPEGILEIPGLMAEDIVEWKRQNTGIAIPFELAEEARVASDGRPILLKPWIDSEDEDLVKITSQSSRFYGYYDEHFGALSNGAKVVGRLLAIAHPHALEIGWMQMASELSQGEVEAAIDALDRKDFCEATPNGYRCRHALIAQFLISMMGTSLIKDYKQRLFNVLGKTKDKTEEVIAPSRCDALKADVVTESSGVEGLHVLVEFTQRVLKLGAYQQARAKLEVIDKLFSSGVSATDDERAEVELLRAEILNELGEYRQALDIVESASFLRMTEAMSAKFFLTKGEAYFRLNDYSNAVQQFKRVRVNASERDDVNHWALSIVRLAGVTMDVGKWVMARRIGNILMENVLPRVIAAGHTSMQCHILRTVARIHAPEESSKAESLIRDALRLARKIDSDRVVGNCFFALGEVLRHAGRTGEAHESYEQALKIAQDTGNKDLAVYSLMGILILALLDGDPNLFESLVDRLRDTIDYDAPAEQANADLFLAIRDLLRGDEIPPESWVSLKDKFMRLRRHWQVRLVDYFQETRNATIGQVSGKIQDLQVVF